MENFKIGSEYLVEDWKKLTKLSIKDFVKGYSFKRQLFEAFYPRLKDTVIKEVTRKLLEKHNLDAKLKYVQVVQAESIVLLATFNYLEAVDGKKTRYTAPETLEPLLGVFMIPGVSNYLLILPLIDHIFKKEASSVRGPKGYVYSKLAKKQIPLSKATRFFNTWINLEDTENPLFIKTKTNYVLNSMSNVKDYISGETIDSDNAVRFVDEVGLFDKETSSEKITFKYTRCILESVPSAVDVFYAANGEMCQIDHESVKKNANTVVFNLDGGGYSNRNYPSSQSSRRIRPDALYTPFNNIVPKTSTPEENKNLMEIVKKINTSYGTQSVTNIITEQKPYTFGVEIETSLGYIPLNEIVANSINVKCVRDGSIRGGEYVTGILTGDQGFLNLKKLTNILRKYCKVDQTCGIHVHIGNYSFTKENIVFIYLLCSILEDELLDMMPMSRRGNAYCTELNKKILSNTDIISLCTSSGTKQEHNKEIEEIYLKLYKYLLYGNNNSDELPIRRPEILHRDSNGNIVPKKVNKNTKTVRKAPHPGGHYAGGRGGPRYNWLNLIPCNFKQKENTSFRLASKSTVLSTLDKLIYSKNNLLNEMRVAVEKDNEAFKKAADSETKKLITKNIGYFLSKGANTVPWTFRDSLKLFESKPLLPKQKHTNISAQELGSFTVEFRLHSGTLSYNKISNWILICMGILSFVENKKQYLIDAILDNKVIDLKTVLTKTYSKDKAAFLINYIEERKKIFTAHASSSEEQQNNNDSTSESILQIIKSKNTECVL